MNNKDINRLWGMRCYLIGAMDRVADNGVGWRRRITPFLEQLGVVALDPTNKPIDIGLENAENRDKRITLKGLGLHDELAREMKLLRAVDLRMVDMSDFLIVNLDTDVHACGTYEETFWANRLKNPTLIHCEQGKDGCPDWLFGVIPHEHIFGTWIDMCRYLWEVHTASQVESYKRWMFFNYQDMMPKVSIEQSSNIKHWNWDDLEYKLDARREQR
jgi:hypothetical protein